MNSLELRSLTSPDVQPYSWSPGSSDDLHFLVEMEIGFHNGPGADMFQAIVATPEGLRKHGSGNPISDRALIVILEFESWKSLAH